MMPSPPPVTARSLLLGLVGTVLICGLSPYNDYVLNNTFLVGNNLPLAVVVVLFGFVVGVNTPLRAWRPASALTHAELAGALAIMLVACAIPGSGLMRYFPASLVGPWWQARGGGDYLTLLTSLRLPEWLFPDFSSDDPRRWPDDPVVVDFVGRWTGLNAYPGWAWLRPAVNWLPFLAALATAVLCLTLILRRQWVDHERLPFPLAQIPLALVEEPTPGRLLNPTLRSRLFWAGLVGVFALHVWNGMSLYLPRYVPPIPVSYDLGAVFTEPPWLFADQKLKNAAVFFTVVGVSYFLSSSVSFSLWGFFLGYQLVRMIQGTATGDPTIYGQQDQHLGGLAAYLLTLLYVGRHHFGSVLRQALPWARPASPASGPLDEHGKYLSYRVCVWLLVASFSVMVFWLNLAGAGVLASAVMVTILLAGFVVVARIVAETGLVHGQIISPVYKPWQLLGAWGLHPVSTQTFYVGSMLQAVHYDYREPLSVYASHGLKVIDADLHEERSRRRRGPGLIAAMGLSLFVGYFVSFAATVFIEYRHSATLDTPPRVPINVWGVETNPRTQMLDATLQYDRSYYFPRHSAAGHLALGFGIVATLAALRLRFAGFPLHPVGFLMIGTYPGSHLWLSICAGWACKQIALKLGGTRLYLAGKPLFLGLVVGESLAAAFWMLGGACLTWLNYPYRVVNIMPG